MSSRRTVVRINGRNQNHHLFNNNGTWWMHWTEHLPDFTKRRVRVSLGTKDVGIARARRDAALAWLTGGPMPAPQDLALAA